jgi:hypothetical protein
VDKLKRKTEKTERGLEEFKKEQQEYNNLHEHVMRSSPLGNYQSLTPAA